MNDVNNFNLYNENNDGSDQIQVENEAGLSIIKTESTILSSPSIPFVLNNVLLVLEIQKNLISVKQFCRDNHIYFEFHDLCFVIKDYSGNILHQGNLKDGLYSFTTTPSPSSPWALSSIRLSISCWHHRLGHVSVFVLNKSPSSSSILVDRNKIQYVSRLSNGKKPCLVV